MKARYRQYFEAEENSSPSNDSMLEDPIIPMETQVGNIPYFNSMNSIDEKTMSRRKKILDLFSKGVHARDNDG